MAPATGRTYARGAGTSSGLTSRHFVATSDGPGSPGEVPHTHHVGYHITPNVCRWACPSKRDETTGEASHFLRVPYPVSSYARHARSVASSAESSDRVRIGTC
jgi:hypothetical protein